MAVKSPELTRSIEYTYKRDLGALLTTYFVGLRLLYLNDLYQNKQGTYFKGGGGGYLANFNLVYSKINK